MPLGSMVHSFFGPHVGMGRVHKDSLGDTEMRDGTRGALDKDNGPLMKGLESSPVPPMTVAAIPGIVSDAFGDDVESNKRNAGMVPRNKGWELSPQTEMKEDQNGRRERMMENNTHCRWLYLQAL